MTGLLLPALAYSGGGLLLANGRASGLALIALTAAVQLAVALALPWHRCAACRGRGEFGLGPNEGDCLICGGHGRYPRWTTRVLTPGRAARMTAAGTDRRPDGRLNQNRAARTAPIRRRGRR